MRLYVVFLVDHLNYQMKAGQCFLLALFFLVSCTKDSTTEGNQNNSTELSDLAASISIAFGYSDEKIQSFLEQPTKAYISAYLQFPEDLGNDVIFGLDLEWAEGVDNPIHFAGADWMSLAGITRDGVLQFPIGSPENLAGTPTPTVKWETRDLDVNLEPNTWYKMTITSDFEKREFHSFQIEGNDINITEDISGYALEYPNYVPYDKPFLTFYTLALRAKEFAPNNEGSAKVYFDDIEAGILVNDSYEIIFSNGFEDQAEIGEIPFIGPVNQLEIVNENYWFYENDDAKLKISNSKSRTGEKSMECNASLAK